eukprot:1552762-Prymnesium_polylepis.1
MTHLQQRGGRAWGAGAGEGRMENWLGSQQEQLSRASGGARAWATRYERTTAARTASYATAYYGVYRRGE